MGEERELLGFRFGRLVDVSIHHGRWPFFDKDTMPIKTLGLDRQVRLVPGGSAVREGAFIGRGVIYMPPMYINIGAYVGECTLVDSPRAGWLVRANRVEGAHQRRRPDWRRD